MNYVMDTGHAHAVLQPELRKKTLTLSARVCTGTLILKNSVVAIAISTCRKSGMKGESGMQECPREDHKVKKEA